MLTGHLQLKMKNKTECFFLMYRSFVMIKHLKLTLVEFVHILTAFYHLPINLVLFTQLVIDTSKYAQVGLNLHAESFFLK